MREMVELPRLCTQDTITPLIQLLPIAHTEMGTIVLIARIGHGWIIEPTILTLHPTGTQLMAGVTTVDPTTTQTHQWETTRETETTLTSPNHHLINRMPPKPSLLVNPLTTRVLTKVIPILSRLLPLTVELHHNHTMVVRITMAEIDPDCTTELTTNSIWTSPSRSSLRKKASRLLTAWSAGSQSACSHGALALLGALVDAVFTPLTRLREAKRWGSNTFNSNSTYLPHTHMFTWPLTHQWTMDIRLQWSATAPCIKMDSNSFQILMKANSIIAMLSQEELLLTLLTDSDNSLNKTLSLSTN